MSFAMIILNQNIAAVQNYATWIQIAIKTEDFTNDVGKRFDKSNYAIKRKLPTGKNLKNNWINER